MKSHQPNRLLFLCQFLSHPLKVGAAIPSSAYLAEYMAKQLPPVTEGLIVELGGGTGVVTRALLKRGVRPEQLIVVERSPVLAKHLRSAFPQLTIIEGNATQLTQLLSAEQRAAVHSIVSSLPLQSMSTADGQMIVQQISTLLKDSGHYIQFTYDIRPRASRVFTLGKQWLQFRSSNIIWRNFPPACVYVFTK